MSQPGSDVYKRQRKRLSIRRQSGVQALDTVAAAWNIQVPYFCSGGVFYWGEQPEQTMTYTFEAGRNILSLARRGSLWDCLLYTSRDTMKGM